MKMILVLFAICITSTSHCLGRSEVSNEDMVVNAIRIALGVYQEENKGKLPKDINEISRLLDLNSSYQNKHPIYREYLYLGSDSSIKTDDGDPLILIRMSPKEDPQVGNGKAGRSFLYKNTKEQNLIRTGWMDELAFQAMLKKAGIPTLDQSMGTVLLKTSGGEKEANEPTDYQKNVIQAYKEGKVPIQKRNSNGDAPSVDQQSSGTDISSGTRARNDIASQSAIQTQDVEIKTSWWLILTAVIGVIATALMVFLVVRDKSPQR